MGGTYTLTNSRFGNSLTWTWDAGILPGESSGGGNLHRLSVHGSTGSYDQDGTTVFRATRLRQYFTSHSSEPHYMTLSGTGAYVVYAYPGGWSPDQSFLPVLQDWSGTDVLMPGVTYEINTSTGSDGESFSLELLITKDPETP